MNGRRIIHELYKTYVMSWGTVLGFLFIMNVYMNVSSISLIAGIGGSLVIWNSKERI